MKLVTTTRTEDGRSAFAEDEEPLRLTASGFPSVTSRPLSFSDGPATLDAGAARTDAEGFIPPPGGYRFFLLTLEPDRAVEQPAPTADQLAEFDRLFPGLLQAHEPGGSGMHTTDTVDLGVVLAGRLVLELDDGARRILETGDAFVQNGTRHRWRNVDPSPAALAVVMLGAKRSG